MDTLFEQIVEDMDRDGFTISDKYKAKYDELGKIQNLSFLGPFFSTSFSQTFSIPPDNTIFKSDHFSHNSFQKFPKLAKSNQNNNNECVDV